MFRAFLCPSSGAYQLQQQQQPLVYRSNMVVAVLLVVVGPVVNKRTDHDQQHYYRHAPTVKPEAATAVVELLMMDIRMPETC